MLSLRWLLNYALLLLIGGLAAVAFFFDRGDEPAAVSGISQLRPGDVERIELSTGLIIEKVDAAWRIAAPVDWPADDTSVERLLGILKLKADALDPGTADLAALGFQPPAAEWRFNDSRLRFGTTNNIGERRYVMIESRLYLLPDVHLAFAAQGLAGFAARSLLPGQDDITALSLPGLDIYRDDSGALKSSPARTPQQLQQVIEAWRTQDATPVRAYPGGAAGDRVEARLASGSTLEFHLLASEPEIVIANPAIGLQYHFAGALRDDLLAAATD